MIVEGYDPETRKFRIATETYTMVRSYIDDIVSTYASKIKVTRATQPPPGERRNRLVYIRVNGTPHGLGQEFDEEIDYPFDTTIGRNGSCEVENRLEIWVAAETEEITHRPARYTQNFRFDVENRLPNGQGLLVRINQGGDRWQENHLNPGESRTLLEQADLPPLQLIYDIRLHTG
jgi:hypothetical protein